MNKLYKDVEEITNIIMKEAINSIDIATVKNVLSKDINLIDDNKLDSITDIIMSKINILEMSYHSETQSTKESIRNLKKLLECCDSIKLNRKIEKLLFECNK